MKLFSIMRGAFPIFMCLAILTSCGGNTPDETNTDTDSSTESGETSIENFDYLNADMNDYISFDSSIYQNAEISLDSTYFVDDTDVDEEIAATLFQYREKINDGAQVADIPIKYGDSAFIYYTGYLDGEAFDNGSNADDADPYELVIGSGSFIPGFEDRLIGVIPSDTSKEAPYELNVTFPESYNNKGLAGKAVIFKVWIVYSVEYVIPELTDDFVTEKLKFTSDSENICEAYKTYIKTSLEQEAETDRKNAVVNYIIDKVKTEATVIEYPEQAVDYHYQYYVSRYEQYMTYYGFDSLDEFLPAILGLDDGEDWHDILTDMAKNDTLNDVIFNSIAQKEVLTVTDEDYQNRVRYYIEYYTANGVQITDEELIQYVGENAIRQDALYNKVYDYLADICKITRAN